ncbi:hypothetical protein CDD80_2350 [Ophiocordyceps camponoti-rufipedis]|uniref:Uncharacterized protein n=1 Tax=Ophiocordyceps camponoti-rufipedis TaxID=2004952 RepID=A0A2C5Z6R4_9HYPO|nr:hypothetical protein CDD80_2350 [Ophiocordyceps camponoti-rufipedis]
MGVLIHHNYYNIIKKLQSAARIDWESPPSSANGKLLDKTSNPNITVYIERHTEQSYLNTGSEKAIFTLTKTTTVLKGYQRGLLHHGFIVVSKENRQDKPQRPEAVAWTNVSCTLSNGAVYNWVDKTWTGAWNRRAAHDSNQPSAAEVHKAGAQWEPGEDHVFGVEPPRGGGCAVSVPQSWYGGRRS